MAHLTDIDSLLLQVRDGESKKLIEEAVTAYRGGALRSAIVATWIAAVYDAIVKLRELKDQGDDSAKKFIEKIDNAIENSNKTGMMNNENEIFSEHFLQNKLLSEHEVEIFSQLQKDRHRCAHPAFITDEVLFRPTSEQVRFYIVHTLNSLLIHAPLQGKNLVEKFQQDVMSNYFPSKSGKAKDFVKERFLKNAKDSLVVSLIKFILSLPFAAFESITPKNANRFSLALTAISEDKRAIFEREAKPYIKRRFSNIVGNGLLYIYLFSSRTPEIWTWLSSDTKEAAKQIVKHIDFALISSFRVFSNINVDELREYLLTEFESYEYENQVKIVKNFSSPEFASFVIEKFENARSFRSAESVGSDLIIPMIEYFSHEDIVHLFNAFMANSQIQHAHGIPAIFDEILDERPDFDAKSIHDKLTAGAAQQSLHSGEVRLLLFLDEYFNNIEATS